MRNCPTTLAQFRREDLTETVSRGRSAGKTEGLSNVWHVPLLACSFILRWHPLFDLASLIVRVQ